MLILLLSLTDERSLRQSEFTENQKKIVRNLLQKKFIDKSQKKNKLLYNYLTKHYYIF